MDANKGNTTSEVASTADAKADIRTFNDKGTEPYYLAGSKRHGKKRLMAGAYHEAAHAVVSIVVGRPFEYVELRSENSGCLVPSNETISLGNALTVVVCAMAGVEAHKKMYPRKSPLLLWLEFGAGDSAQVEKWLNYFSCGNDSLKKEGSSISQAIAKTQVEENWEKIKKVGNELLKRGRLTYDEVQGIINPKRTVGGPRPKRRSRR